MNGTISAGIFRVLAVVSALAIGGGYVLWRQAGSRKNVAEQAEAKAIRQREKHLREMDEAWQESYKELELLPGSKNPARSITRGEIEGILDERGDFIQPIPGIPDGAKEVSNIKTRLLPGSKSMPMPLFTKEQISADGLLPPIKELDEEETTKPETKPKRPILLPGSKVGIFIPTEIVPEKSE